MLQNMYGFFLQVEYVWFLLERVNYIEMHIYFYVHTGSYASYLVPAAALGAMGYCYMWWKVSFCNPNP